MGVTPFFANKGTTPTVQPDVGSRMFRVHGGFVTDRESSTNTRWTTSALPSTSSCYQGPAMPPYPSLPSRSGGWAYVKGRLQFFHTYWTVKSLLTVLSGLTRGHRADGPHLGSPLLPTPSRSPRSSTCIPCNPCWNPRLPNAIPDRVHLPT